MVHIGVLASAKRLSTTGLTDAFLHGCRRDMWNTVRIGVEYRIQVYRDVIPFTALVVSICALSFQVTILHPFHEALNEEFDHVTAAAKILSVKASKLQLKMDTVLNMEREIESEEESILNKAEVILGNRRHLDQKLDRLVLKRMSHMPR
jgi:hypothetical protein